MRSRMPCTQLALAVTEAGLQEAAQRRAEIAVVQQVVGDLLEHRVGIELEPPACRPSGCSGRGGRAMGATVPVGEGRTTAAREARAPARLSLTRAWTRS